MGNHLEAVADQYSSDRRGADFPGGGGGALVRYQRGISP